MANTYTQIHLQFIFATQFRHGTIDTKWKEDLHRYITGIVQNQSHKLLAINSMPDHVHMLVGMRPVQSVSDLLQDIKADSSKWINDNNLVKGRFEWQTGYGAFSYGVSQISKVIKYIETQEEHHREHTFLEEYNEFLKIFKVEYDERYIFKEPI